MKGQGYNTYYSPAGNSYASVPLVSKAGFEEGPVEKVLEGDEAAKMKKDRKKVMYKARAVPSHQICIKSPS